MLLLMAFKHFLVSCMIGGFALAVGAVDQAGFISIDCGLSDVANYTDPVRGLKYISDAAFIDTGKSRFILLEYLKNYARCYQSLRSFPEGDRNCYKITGITRGTKYLIRALFAYGNYDEQDAPPVFDLYLGTDLWDSIIFESPLEPVSKEIIHVPRHDFVHVCLAKTGDGIPFISSLEIRPLASTSYHAEMGHSLLLIQRIDAGSAQAYRYRDDIHDRFWTFLERDDWTSLNTSSAVNFSGQGVEPPPAVMKTAAMPKTINYLDISWQVPADQPDNTSSCFVYMHFAEVEKLQPNQSRAFEILHNGEFFYGPYTPSHLIAQTIYSPTALIGGAHTIKISKTPNSTLPPIINAWEVYRQKEFLQSETDQQDADAMTTIKSTYGVKRNSWQGDPCLPKVYLWEGIDCSYDDDNAPQAPRVISLNLSSSGLTGDFPPSIANLTMIKILDLSNNKLRGSMPDFLSQLPNLKFLNLEKNDFTGSVPVGLAQKWKDGLLSLSVCGNPNISSTVLCKKKHHQKSLLLPVAAPVVGTFVVVSTLAAIWWSVVRKRKNADSNPMYPKGTILDTMKREFAYMEIISITNNFENILGEGGFGKVYYGYVNNIQVAVKMLSVSSVQGYHQFQAEVNLLMRVHHKSLIDLVGYCNEDNKVALIYEYMANGNLLQHLSGSSNILEWRDRLLIATDVAQEM